MRKKYLSALLFGALVMASTATFTSCKDYDDDIDNLQSQITANADAIKKLQDLVGAGKFVTNVSKVTDGITITWNDGSSTTLNGTDGKDGADGKDGKDGSVVTIGENNNWFIDGKDTGICAKGEKGDKGDQGDQGEQGPAGEDGAAAEAGKDGADGHDAKISNGFWAVWDAEKGEYVETSYLAGGINAVWNEAMGGYNLTISNADGSMQEIFLPASAKMGYMDVLEMNKLAPNNDMKVIYAINAKDVVYGPKDNEKTFEKGLYSTLDRDLYIVVNPQGVDASRYEFSLMNSENTDTQVAFQEAVPYKGLLTRAASENGVWVLNNAFTRYEDINDARTKNYLLFKSNDSDKHALTLTAKDGDNVIKTPYNLGAKLKKYEAKVAEAQKIETLAVDTWKKPEVKNDAGVYDYWLTIEPSASNLKKAILYGVEISEDGYSFRYTKNQGVSDKVKLVYNYIRMDGSVCQGTTGTAQGSTFIVTLTEQMAAEKTISLERFVTPLDAKLITNTSDLLTQAKDADVHYTYNRANGKLYQEIFSLKTQAYSLDDLTAEMNDTEKIVWLSALANNKVTFDLIGGEGDNNEHQFNSRIKDNIRYFVDTNKNTITFQFLVSNDWQKITDTGATAEGSVTKNNFFLNNAYELTMTVTDEDFLNTVATIVLPFEFTQPTLDITHLEGVGDFTKWTTEGGETVLYSFGAYGNNKMGLPLYEAFEMWETKYVMSKANPNAKYYKLTYTKPTVNGSVVYDGVALFSDPGSAATTGGTLHDGNAYYGDWMAYKTFAINDYTQTNPYEATATSWRMLTSHVVGKKHADYRDDAPVWTIAPNSKAAINVDVTYDFYGVYRATQEQIGYYKDANGDKQTGFKLVFASTIREASLKTKESKYYANANTNDVKISNSDVEAITALNREFVLFDGLDDNELTATRASLNRARGFNEAQRPFADLTELTTASNNPALNQCEISAKYVYSGDAIGIDLDASNSNKPYSLASDPWEINLAVGTIKPKVPALITNSAKIKVYEVASSQKYAPGATVPGVGVAPNGLPSVEAGLIFQLGNQIEDRQPIEITIKVKDSLGFYNELKVIVQKLQ